MSSGTSSPRGLTIQEDHVLISPRSSASSLRAPDRFLLQASHRQDDLFWKGAARLGRATISAAMSTAARRKVGITLVAGLLVIVTAVITVLEIANGPGWGPGGPTPIPAATTR